MLASNHNALTMKMEYLSKKSVRHRLMSFLNFQAEKHKSSEFHINFDRKELAEFLFVDRSALSRELGRMRRAKIIEFSKNRFKILKSGI
jgi:CRP-like cAMP-binding protein